MRKWNLIIGIFTGMNLLFTGMSFSFAQTQSGLSVEEFKTQSDTLIQQRDFAKATDLSENIIEKNLSDEDKIEYYLQLQKLYDPIHAGNFDSVFYYINQVLSLTKSDSLKTQQYFSLGSMQVYTGDFAGGNKSFLYVSERMHFLPSEMDSIKLISRLALTSPDAENKLKWLEMLSDLAEQSTNPIAKVFAYFDQLNYYIGKQDVEKIKEVLPRFKSAHYGLRDSSMVSTAAKLISACYTEKGLVNPDSSEFYLKKAMNYLTNQLPAYEEFSLQLRLATNYLIKEQYNLAITNALAGIEGLEKSGKASSDAVRQAYSTLGLSFEALGQLEEALVYFQKELELARPQKALDFTRRALRSVLRVKLALGQTNDIHPVYDELFVLQDSLNTQYNQKQVTEAEARLGLTLKEQELENKNLRITQQEQQQKWYIALIGLLSAVLAGAFLFFRRIKRDKKVISQQKIEVEKALTEKEFLLKEVHHRVKNNLQIISSLLDKQARNSGDTSLKDKMQEGKDRIQSMALIHQNLYQSESLSNIDIRKYIYELAQNIAATQQALDQNIKIDLLVDDLYLNIDQAIPVGLILNELLTNTFKHAFKDRAEGLVTVRFLEVSKGKFELHFSDNGKGMPPEFDLQKSKTLGMSLINGLVQQLEGDLQFDSSANGTNFYIQFPV